MKRLIGIGLGIGAIASIGVANVDAAETGSLEVTTNVVSDPEFKVDSTFKGFGSRRGPFKPIESLEIDRDFTNFLSGKSDKIYGVYKDGTRTDLSLGDSSKLTLYPSIEATVLDTRSDSNVSGWTLSYSGTATVLTKTDKNAK